MRRLLPAAAALLVVAVLLPACSPSHHDARAPSLVASSSRGLPNMPGHGPMDDGSPGYFPLEPGNWWRFDYRFESYVVEDGGSRVDYPTLGSEIEHRVVCGEDADGLTYDVVRVSSTNTEGMLYWVYYREDRDGLYERDGIGGPPACDTLPYDPKKIGAPSARTLPGDIAWSDLASRPGVAEHEAAWRLAWERLRAKRASLAALAAGAGPASLAPGEIQRLAYPLHPGQSWQIRPELNFRAVVERAVMLRTPAGALPTWSLRITNDQMSPDDVVRTWYGRTGYLGLDARLQSVATDESGNVYGTLYVHQSETLTGLYLARGGSRSGHDRFPHGGLALGR